MASTDNHGGHVSALAFFTIAEEKLKEYEARVLDSLERTKEGTLKTGQCLYYGFAKCGNTMVCREGYKTAMDFFPHLAEVKENLDQDIAGADKFHPDIFGREDHMGLIKTVTADLVRDTGATLFEMDDGSQAFFNKVDQTIEPDNHVTLVSFYKVPDERLVEVKEKFATFYENKKSQTDDCLYFGFGLHPNTVISRAGYKDAQGLLKHLGNIKEELKYFTDIVGEGNEEVVVVGPKSELDMLREPLKSINTKFYETCIGAVKTFC